MIVITANETKDNLFKYLDEITDGKKIIIQKDQKNIACLSHIPSEDWRNKMTIRPKLLVPPEKLMEPLSDIWEGYV